MSLLLHTLFCAICAGCGLVVDVGTKLNELN
jgi:hypothetical protein